MYHQKYLIILRRIKVEIRTIKVIFLVPLFILMSLSIRTYITTKDVTVDEILRVKLDLITVWECILPILSLWWIFFSSQEYTEGKGSELLWINKNPTKMWDLAIYHIAFGVFMLPIYFISKIYVPDLLFHYFILVIEGLVLSLLYIFLQFFFNASFLGITTVTILHFSQLFICRILPENIAGKISFYSNGKPIVDNVNAFVSRCFPVCIVCFVLFLLGIFTMRKPKMN